MAVINGAHVIIYSTNPDADRALLRDVFKLPNIDAGDGWLIFGLPPAEVACHPSDANDVHELYFMCDDVNALVASMSRRNIACSPVEDHGWGLLTQMTLPGGGKLGIYEPKHARPRTPSARKPAKKPVRRAKTRRSSATTKKRKRWPATNWRA